MQGGNARRTASDLQQPLVFLLTCVHTVASERPFKEAGGAHESRCACLLVCPAPMHVYNHLTTTCQPSHCHMSSPTPAPALPAPGRPTPACLPLCPSMPRRWWTSPSPPTWPPTTSTSRCCSAPTASPPTRAAEWRGSRRWLRGAVRKGVAAAQAAEGWGWGMSGEMCVHACRGSMAGCRPTLWHSSVLSRPGELWATSVCWECG